MGMRAAEARRTGGWGLHGRLLRPRRRVLGEDEMRIVPVVPPSGLLLIAVLALARVPEVAASHDLPHTFGACVLAGGDVSLRGGWPTCVAIELGYDRVYATMECGNGNEVPYEIWVRQRTTTVTYLLQPERTSEQSHGGIDGTSRLATPSPDACPAS
jgi:hypothetical protein